MTRASRPVSYTSATAATGGISVEGWLDALHGTAFRGAFVVLVSVNSVPSNQGRG